MSKVYKLTESQFKMVINRIINEEEPLRDSDGNVVNDPPRDGDGNIIYNDTEDNRFRSPARRATLPVRPKKQIPQNNVPKQIPQNNVPKQQPLREFDDEDFDTIED